MAPVDPDGNDRRMMPEAWSKPLRSLIWAPFAALATIGSVQAAGPAFIGDFRHPTNGLAITVPEAFQATAAQPIDGAMVSLRNEQHAYCMIVFSAKPANAVLAQKEINAALSASLVAEWGSDPKHKDRKLISTSPADKADLAGFAILSDFRRSDSRRYRRRNLTFLWETPKGRTTLGCSAPKVRFDILRRDFEKLAAGVTPPR